jgi:hypothetical protein
MQNCFKSGNDGAFNYAALVRKAYHVRMRSADPATDIWLNIQPPTVARREEIADEDEDDDDADKDKNEDDDDTNKLEEDSGYSE